jgi:ParB/RepB/Spo0J family partition protein
MAWIGDLPGVVRQNVYAVPPEHIVTDPAENSRRFPSAESIDSLIASILEDGQQVPIKVRRGRDNSLHLVYGTRRLEAIRQINAASLGPKPLKVSCQLVDATDETAFISSVVENAQRGDLSPIDQAHAAGRLRKEFGKTNEEIGRILGGKSAGWVSQITRLLDLDLEIQRAVHSGKLAQTTAYEMLSQAPDKTSGVVAELRAERKREAAARTANSTASREPAGEKPEAKPARAIKREQVRRAKRPEPPAETAEAGEGPRSRHQILSFWTETSELGGTAYAARPSEDVRAFAKDVLRHAEGGITDRQLLNRLLKLAEK